MPTGEVTVWQVLRPVPAGKAITAADLRPAAVAGSIASGALPANVTPAGQVARVPIPAGALLTPAVVTAGPALPGPGEALVGVALGPGAAPADGLAASYLVRVVRVPVTEEEAKLRPAGTAALPGRRHRMVRRPGQAGGDHGLPCGCRSPLPTSSPAWALAARSHSSGSGNL